MKREIVYLTGWLTALVLGLIMLSVGGELRTPGVIIGCVAAPVVSVVLALCKSATNERGVDWSSIKSVALGGGITAAVFLFAYWMGCINASTL